MSNSIDPAMCSRIKVFARPSFNAVLSKSSVRVGDLEVPLVIHVYSDATPQVVLTVACTRHWMQHDKQNCMIRVFGENGQQEPVGSLSTTLIDFEKKALAIVRTQLKLGPPKLGGAAIRFLQALQITSLVLSVVVTAAAVVFVSYQVWNNPVELLESKNPGMIAAWLLPGSGLFGVSAWANGRISAMRSARL